MARMNGKRWVLAAAGTIVLALGGVGVGTTVAAGATDPGFTLAESDTHFAILHAGQEVTNPNQAPVPGDELLISGDLVQYPHTVGYEEIRCNIQFNNNALCTGTFKLNQGQITGHVLIDDITTGGSQPFDVAILGGTGLWDTARGSVHVAPLDQNNSLLTFDID